MVMTAGLAVLGIVVFVVVFRVPDADRSPDESSPSTLAAPVSDDPAPEPDEPDPVVVVGSGEYVNRVLSGTEFTFFTATGLGVSVVTLGSGALVWQLGEENPHGFDVIEVGFRLDALAGAGDDRFVPVDLAVVENLTFVPDEFQVDANGIVPGLDGALGLFTSGFDGQPAPEMGGWDDLLGAAESGATVVIPGPPLHVAVVFTWAVGDGDPVAGLERYQRLVDAGAVPLSSTTALREQADEGPLVGAWTSAGVKRLPHPYEALFIVPDSGAVALPAFSAVLADSDVPEDGQRWLNHRLSSTVQRSMTFDQVLVGLNEEVPIPLVPVVPLGEDARPFTAFDPHTGDDYVVFDWKAVWESVEAINDALSAIVMEG